MVPNTFRNKAVQGARIDEHEVMPSRGMRRLRIFDLTREFSEDISILKIRSCPIKKLRTDLRTHRQTDTRIDAPAFMLDRGKTVDQLATELFLRDAVLLDLTGKKSRQLIDDEDLEAAEERAGLAVREGEVVIIRTGWEKFVHSKGYLLEHPSLSKNAAQFLEFKRVAGVAVDTPNLDDPDNENLSAHSILLRRGIFIVENLCNLDKLDRERFRLVALPLRVRASCSPVRAIAILDDSA
jgi:kynurenine formamidase